MAREIRINVMDVLGRPGPEKALERINREFDRVWRDAMDRVTGRRKGQMRGNGDTRPLVNRMKDWRN